jgi:lysozyme
MKNLREFSEIILEGESQDRAIGIFDQIIERYQKISPETRNIILNYSLTSLIGISSLDLILTLVEKIRGKKNIEYEASKKIINDLGFNDPLLLKLSTNGINLIKNHEKLVKKGYKIGDGKITIGYGHAEDISKSTYKVGQKITPEKAEELLKKDLKKAEDGVKRIFKEWKLKGINIKITQDMFDSLISMAFNMGISGLRKSKMIQNLKLGKYKRVGEMIKRTNIDPDFPGLEKRRKEESELFLSFINKIKRFNK